MKLKKLFSLCCIIPMLFCFQQLSIAVTNNFVQTKIVKNTIKNEHITTEGTLPNGWPHWRYQQHIADILDWVPTEHLYLLCPGYFKEPIIVSQFPNSASIKKESVIITAKGPSIITANGISILRKEVSIIQPGRILQANTAYIDRDAKTGHITKIILIGHVHLYEAGKSLVADQGILILFPKTAMLTNTAYHIYSDTSFIHKFDRPFNGWGTAKHATCDKFGVITLRHAIYSTCDPAHPAWWISASNIILNKKTHRGEAYNALIHFERVPILYFPYYNFPIDHQRKTGFLTPSIEYNNYSGKIFSLPFYWNMAPNYDLTLTSEIMSKRGLNTNALFRFLSKRSKGNIYLSYLPNDIAFRKFRQNIINNFSILSDNPSFIYYVNKLQMMKKQRSFLTINDTTSFNSKWSSHVILNYVTDPYYFQDLGWQLGVDNAANQLLNQIDLQYSGLHSQFSVLLQDYQTLHLITAQFQNTPLDQYSRLPDFSIEGYYPDIAHNMDFNFSVEAVNFEYKSNFPPKQSTRQSTGQRFHMRSGLSFPTYFASGHFILQIWGDAIAYNVIHLQPGQFHTVGRVLPIFDIDSHLYFDQYLQIGNHSFIETLEPHFFYLYIPYQNQEKLPNFDTVLLPISFEQLFAINQYTGDDRLQNANQITFALTSNLLDTSSNNLLLSANIGFIYYIKNQRVCLANGEYTSPNYHFSAIVGDLVWHLVPHWSLLGSLAWDPYLSQKNDTSITLTYQNWEEYVDITYVFIRQRSNYIALNPAVISRNPFKRKIGQFILSTTWPIFKKWSVTSYWGYNISQNHTDNYSIGVQYDTCCWTLSFLTRRSYKGLTLNTKSNLQNIYDTAYLVQFQLKGLGDFGTSPILTRKSISNVVGNKFFDYTR